MSSPHDLTAADQPDAVHLEPWEEVCGYLEGLEQVDGELRVHLSVGTLSQPVKTSGADLLQERLSDHIGAKVGILRRPSTTQPYAVTTQLEPWQEVAGQLESVKESDQTLTVVLSTREWVSFRAGSPAAQNLREELSEMEGQRITLLRTDEPDRPVAIREVDDDR